MMDDDGVDLMANFDIEVEDDGLLDMQEKRSNFDDEDEDKEAEVDLKLFS